MVAREPEVPPQLGARQGTVRAEDLARKREGCLEQEMVQHVGLCGSEGVCDVILGTTWRPWSGLPNATGSRGGGEPGVRCDGCDAQVVLIRSEPSRLLISIRAKTKNVMADGSDVPNARLRAKSSEGTIWTTGIAHFGIGDHVCSAEAVAAHVSG